MTPVNGPLNTKATKTTGEALQGSLVDLINLTLAAKQAHWNLVGKRFRSVHLQLDEVVTAARQYTDDVAERAAALGVSPDGRADTVAGESGFPQVHAGWLKDDDAVAGIVAALGWVIERMRDRIAATDEPDPVTQDLLIQATAELEKQSWMFQAMK
ncbi:MAG: DNA starvation/stationary phase protection protein [Streptosporangiales bacterium]|nr:DNA starvation/stationary phase protection protein [Streptosporangiales bacterium]MBO0890781.1 DNA starvation/stationary phase protection protein [Acidothermales bacterium]